jgi:hypothetical protein
MAAAFGNEMLLRVQFISTKIHASKTDAEVNCCCV